MKLYSRIDAVDNWLQTAKEVLMQDAGKYDPLGLGRELDEAATALGRVQDKLREISDADGWREA